MTSHANGRSKTASAVHRVEVTLKAGLPDSAGTSVLAQLPLLGIASANEVRVGSLYEISGPITATQAHALAQNFLADPVLHDFVLHGSRDGRSPANGSGPHWRIEVWLKPSVSDPIGDSVRKAVVDLGLPAPETVRCAMIYRILGRVNQAQAEKIAVKLLANPVIHRFSVAAG